MMKLASVRNSTDRVLLRKTSDTSQKGVVRMVRTWSRVGHKRRFFYVSGRIGRFNGIKRSFKVSGGVLFRLSPIRLTGIRRIRPRDRDVSKLDSETKGLAHEGESGSGGNVEDPPHEICGESGMHGGSRDMGDQQGGGEVDAALRAAHDGHEGQRGRADGGDEQGRAGDPAGEVTEGYVGVVEDLVAHARRGARGIVEDEQQEEVRGVETGLQQRDLGEN